MNICAIIVSYHPTVEIIENVLALLQQVDEVVVVDNASDSVAQQHLALLKDHGRVKIIYNEQNLGIAAALNIGVRYSKEAGHQWVATFDQDSRVSPGMIPAMLEAYEAYPDKKSIAILCPRYRDKATGRMTSHARAPGGQNQPVAEALTVMTSGNLVRLSAFDTVGHFNESLFIDYVDNEFCLRCAQKGYKILEIQDAILEHSVGCPTEHRFFSRTVMTTNHSPIRRYYNARNRVYVYRQYGADYPAWVMQDSYIFLKEVLKLVLYEEQKRKKLVKIATGIFHGLTGALGKGAGL